MSGSVEILSAPSALLRQSSRTNTRIPPIARRSSSPFPCRMALISRHKLERETTARSPDLRRCLGHNRLLRRSIELAQADMKKAMATMQLDDSSDSEDELDDICDESPVAIIREQISNAVKGMVRRRSSSQPPSLSDSHGKNDLVRTSSSKSSRSSSSSELSLSRTASLSSRGRQYAAKFAGRKLWHPGHAVQAMVS